MNSTAWSTEVTGLLDVLGSFTEEKDVTAGSIPLRVSVFMEVKRQENPSPGPGPLALLLPIDEIKLGRIVHGLPSQCLDHVKPKLFWIIEKRKVHEKEDIEKRWESQYWKTVK
jgi:hypothetical protein